jgi:osmotically-inducible protein OsmY
MSLGLVLYEPQLLPHEGGPAVHDGALPESDDARLADSIRQSLRASGYTVLSAVAVTVRAGSVALRGTVPSYFMKQIAQEVAKATAGVTSLTNRLTVRVPSADPN